MHHYLAPYTPSATNHPLFKARGIHNQTEGDLKSLGVFALPHERALAYDGYKANISTFVAATNRQMRLNCNTGGTRLSNPSRELLDIPHPPVCFLITAGRLSDDQQQAVVRKLADYECERHMSGKTPVYVCQKPNVTLAPKLEKVASDLAAHHPNATSSDGYKTFLHILLCISEFLRTNSYPSFASDSADNRTDHLLSQQAIDIQVAYQVATREPDEGTSDEGRI